MSRVNTKTAEKLTVWLGGTLLLLLVILSWVPTGCPVLKRQLVGCPSYIYVPVTHEEKEVARIPHQIVKSTASFKVKADKTRDATLIKFSYWGDPNYSAIMAVQSADKYQDLALITHPLLTNLKWSALRSSNPPVSLYQKQETYASIEDFRKDLPSSRVLAVDPILAAAWQLDPSNYQPLEKLSSLENIEYVLTSYAPSVPDDLWLYYEQAFDLTGVSPDSNGEISWRLILSPITESTQPFRLSNVHIEFRQ